MNKKVLLIALAVCLCLFCFFAIAALPSAAEGMSLEGDRITDAEAGKTYSVSVSYSGVTIQPIQGITIAASWNTDSLELVSVEKGASVLNPSMFFFFTNGLEDSNSDGINRATFACADGTVLNPGSGELIVYTFKVKAGAADSSQISLSLDSFGYLGTGSESHDYASSFSITNGSITLKGKTPDTGSSGNPVTAPAPGTTTPPATTSQGGESTAPDPISVQLSDKFPLNKKTFSDSLFSDLNKKAWYYTNGYIQTVYGTGLMEGYGDKIFAPEESLTIAQAVTLAVRLNSIFAGGSGKMSPSEGQKWYTPYFNYAYDAGILTRGRFSNPDKTATRAEMAELLAAALPDACYAKINSLVSLPDVSASNSAFSSILKLYNAGVLQGDDSTHTFRPDSDIRRSEVAAILVRLICVEKRISFR